MDIRPYKSGRKGLHLALEAAPYESESRLTRLYPPEESLALDARVTQEDAFCHAANGSLRYLLLLSGVLPGACDMDDPDAFRAGLQAVAPEACPGANGPIAILLIL